MELQVQNKIKKILKILNKTMILKKTSYSRSGKLVANFLQQKLSLEKEIENQEFKLNEINRDISQQENNQESYQQIIYEKEQYLAYEKKILIRT